MSENIAGVPVPDTPLVRAITAYVRDSEDDLLFHHSRRLFLFGALQGRRRGLAPNLELLYAGAMFHDIGLAERCRNSTLPRCGWAPRCTPFDPAFVRDNFVDIILSNSWPE